MPITPTTQENSNNYYDFPVNLSSTNPQLLSVFITELLQQELNTNNPITTQIINDYIDSTSPDAPLSNSTPSNTILSNSTSSSEIYNDSELYDLDSDMPPLIGDHDELFDYDSDSDNDTVVAPLICSNASIP